MFSEICNKIAKSECCYNTDINDEKSNNIGSKYNTWHNCKKYQKIVCWKYIL